MSYILSSAVPEVSANSNTFFGEQMTFHSGLMEHKIADSPVTPN